MIASNEMDRLLYKIIMILFITISFLRGQVPPEQKDLTVGVGPTYNIMKAQFYDLNKDVEDAPGFSVESCILTGHVLRFGIRYWSSTHELESKFYPPVPYNFRGFEGFIKLVLIRKLRWRPYFLLSYAKVGLQQKNGDGFSGVGHSIATGLEYWLNRNISSATEVDLRYVDYQGIQGNHSRSRIMGAFNGSMIAFHLLTLYWHFD